MAKTAAFKESGISVRVYKRPNVSVYSCAFRIEGTKVQRSTGETARDRAVAEARKIVQDEIERAQLDVTPGDTLTWGQLFRVYWHDRIPMLSTAWRQASLSRRELFEASFGTDTLVVDLDQNDADRFAHLRTTGQLSPSRKNVRARAVTIGTVEADIRWLNTVIRWAMRRKVDGKRLLTLNPLEGLDRPEKNKNPRRPVASEDRYRATRAHAAAVDPALPALLDLARYTGRRIGAICSLKASDILWTRDDVEATLAGQGEDTRLADHYPQGAIHWSEESDKMGVGWITPMSPRLRDALDEYRQHRSAIGDAPLFPSPEDPSKPLRSRLAGRWLLKAEAVAHVPKLQQGRWHPYRRLFANELQHVPSKVAAMLGGWKDPRTMEDIYQNPDGGDLYDAATQVGA